MSEGKSKQIEFLKRENRRKNTEKMMAKFNESGFIPQEENDIFCKKVFLKVLLEKQLEIKECNFEANVLKSKQILEQVDKNNKVFVRPSRLLVSNGFEVEAVSINAIEVLKDIELACEISGFNKGMFDFMLVADDLSYGVCIERGEYSFIQVFWGVA